MRVLPVVERELRVAVRRPAVFWTRTTAALLAVLFGGSGLWLGSEWRSAAELGSSMFRTLSTVAFLFCLVAGPVFTSDVISEEKREGTLGLLFLTDLKGYDVVLGKLAAASVNALMSLLAVLPVLSIAFLLGGVPLTEFGRIAVLLLNTLLLSLAVGVLVSSLCVEARSAFALSGFLLFVLAGLLPWLTDVARAGLGEGWVTTTLTTLSPVSSLLLTRTGAVGQSVADVFWSTIVVQHALVWGVLAAAGVLTARSWHELGRLVPLERWRARWHTLTYGAPAERRQLRTQLLERSPVLWLASRHRLKHQALWLSVGLALFFWLLIGHLPGSRAMEWGSVFFVALLIQSPLKWLMASEATQRWVQERQQGGLELLLTTPLTVQDLLGGHALALRRLFGPPVLAVLLVEAYFLAGGIASGQQDLEMGLLALVQLGLLVWDLYTLGWLGLWLGLDRHKPNQAFVGAVVRVLIVPWLVFLAVLFVVGARDWLMVPITWLVVAGTCNFLFTQNAREKLSGWFREMASAQTEIRRPTPLASG